MGKILYVDIDTINEKYTFIKNQKQSSKAGRTSWGKSKSQGAVSPVGVYRVSEKAQAGELTQQQAMAMEKSLTDKQQALAQQEQKLSTQLVENAKDSGRAECKDEEGTQGIYGKIWRGLYTWLYRRR